MHTLDGGQEEFGDFEEQVQPHTAYDCEAEALVGRTRQECRQHCKGEAAAGRDDDGRKEEDRSHRRRQRSPELSSSEVRLGNRTNGYTVSSKSDPASIST